MSAYAGALAQAGVYRTDLRQQPIRPTETVVSASPSSQYDAQQSSWNSYGQATGHIPSVNTVPSSGTSTSDTVSNGGFNASTWSLNAQAQAGLYASALQAQSSASTTQTIPAHPTWSYSEAGGQGQTVQTAVLYHILNRPLCKSILIGSTLVTVPCSFIRPESIIRCNFACWEHKSYQNISRRYDHVQKLYRQYIISVLVQSDILQACCFRRLSSQPLVPSWIARM